MARLGGIAARILGSAFALYSAPSLAVEASATTGAPEVSRSVRVDESRPMRDIVRDRAASPLPQSATSGVVPNIFPDANESDRKSDALRAAAASGVQRAPTGIPAPDALLSFDGASHSESGQFIPPDTNGDVSPAHYIQWVNIRWSIYDKITGARISGPTDGNSFWSGFGGPCESRNDGDPIALWDDRAARWVMTQFILEPPYAQCFAISTTADPLGTWYRYEFALPLLGDYPHLGVWTDAQASQDAYLLVTHDFIGTGFEGSSFIALERDRMLQGLSAQMVRFPGIAQGFGALPVHLEGPQPAPAGACPVFVHFDDAGSEYLFWDLCLRWDAAAASTLSERPTRLESRDPFIANLTEVTQPDAAATLSTFGRNLMYRATGRAFPAGAPTPMSLVVNHYVEGADDNGGIRWVDFRLRPAGEPASPDLLFANGFEQGSARILDKAIHDEGTYAPDAQSRWLGAIAVDRSGNLGLGYSVGSETLPPQLRITGREANDAPGTMRDERQCSPTGTGSQLDTSGRWGDYASMSVDPVDECTFWFTSEYYAVTSGRDWDTRICSFRFPDCGLPTFALVAESPTRVETCGAPAMPAPTIALRVGVLDGFDDAVALTSSGQPPGISPQFSPAVVDPTPGTSTLTLQSAGSVPAGEYALLVSATSGATRRDLPISLGVSSAATLAPVLVSPVDDATGTKVRPTLAWSEVAGAIDYRVDVATDPGFAVVLASAVVTGTEWPSSFVLDASTRYYWRVRARNYCGDGAVSPTRTFTTGVPGQCPTGSVATLVLGDDFENGNNGWTATGSGASAWALQPAPAGTGLSTTVWRVRNNPTTSDRSLVSPALSIPADARGVILSFDAYHSFELDSSPPGCWDGAALEAKSVTDVDWEYQGANRVFVNGYNGRLLPQAPLAGREVWCRTPAGNTARRTIVDLDHFAGRTLELRFRATTDSNTVALPEASNGLSIDNLRVDVCR